MDWNNYYNEQINKSNNQTLNKVSDFNGNQVGGGRLLNFFRKSIDPFGLTELAHYNFMKGVEKDHNFIRDN